VVGLWLWLYTSLTRELLSLQSSTVTESQHICLLLGKSNLVMRFKPHILFSCAPWLPLCSRRGSETLLLASREV
jgi:hypothetical protein